MELTLPILQMRTLRLREVKGLTLVLYWLTEELSLGPRSVSIQS